MNFTKKWYMIGAALFTVFAGGVLVGSAAPAQEFVQVIKDSRMKVYKDGIPIVAKDHNGKQISPLILDGVTYVPIRAIGEGTGLDVSYDDEKRIVHLNTKQPEGNLRLVDYKGRSGGNVLLSLVDKDLNPADTDFSHGAIVKGNTKLSFTFPEGTYRAFESDIVVLNNDPNAKAKKTSKRSITIRAFEVVNGKEVAFFTDTFKMMKTSSEGEHLSIRIEGKKDIRIAVEGSDSYTQVIFGDAYFRK
ncbi:stalk domain-containing protein [Brevibacillus reuszeri]|uniref:stalk domain-containing protein n=1 Tax=Brevibacillus reuszeri TaxID=54915 RepID=UPI000CCC5E8E|nr:stalk domain-containing protein [Brevibacillus reuszeri]